jgi:phospholipase/carboxylesterase
MTTTLRDVRSTGWTTSDVPDAVVLFLHGFGSNEQDLSGLAPALGFDLPWASLRAPLELGNGGAAWFEITIPGAPYAAPVEAATEAIWAWIDQNVDPATRVIPVGFSQGGLMASQLLRTRPERVTAPVILGGFVLGATQPGDEDLRENLPAVFWGRGSEDRVIAPVAITRTTEFLPVHSALVEKVYPGLAHGINAAELDDVRDFITANLGAEVVSGA